MPLSLTGLLSLCWHSGTLLHLISRQVYLENHIIMYLLIFLHSSDNVFLCINCKARCMASRTPKIATIGCFIGGLLTFFVGIPFSYLGAITRVYYGPDSAQASFKTDSCSIALGLPTCAAWEPDADAFIKLLTHEAPPGLGGWCLIGIVAASMSSKLLNVILISSLNHLGS